MISLTNFLHVIFFSFLQIWSHLLKKSLIEIFIFCTAFIWSHRFFSAINEFNLFIIFLELFLVCGNANTQNSSQKERIIFGESVNFGWKQGKIVWWLKRTSRHLSVRIWQWKHKDNELNLFKVNKYAPERRHLRRFNAFIVIFEQSWYITLVFPILALNKKISTG